MNDAGIVPLNDLPDLKLPELDAKRATEDDFMRDLVAACNTVRKYLLIAAGLVPTIRRTKVERGVLIGHMVRIYKLYDTYLHLIVERRGEMAFIIVRAFTESLINLRFLIRFGNEELIRTFQIASLAYEKKLWDEIQSRKHDPILPIEERMLSSIEKTFARATVDLDSVSFEDRNWGESAYRKAQQTDLINLYEFGFRTASHFVHGTWHELEFHHLRESGDDYEPAPDYTPPKPQMIEAISVSCLEVAGDYLPHIVGDSASEIVDRLDAMKNWFVGMVSEHEKFIGQRQ